MEAEQILQYLHHATLLKLIVLLCLGNHLRQIFVTVHINNVEDWITVSKVLQNFLLKHCLAQITQGLAKIIGPEFSFGIQYET